MVEETNLKSLLAACRVLVGVDEPARKIALATKPTSLSDVLSRRLDQTRQLDLVLVPQQPNQDASERSLKLATSDAAGRALIQLERRVSSSELDHDHKPTPSTSTAPPPPPVFGIRDIKVIGMLAGIVARWGIGLALDETVLPPAFADSTRAQPHSRIQEVTDEDEQQHKDTLSTTVSMLLSLVTRTDRQTDGQRQLGSIVAPQVTPLLLAGLCQLAYNNERSGDWNGQLETFANSLPVSASIATLLPLLSSAASPTWFKAMIAKLLSDQLTRPGGVRSLLVVVVGSGSAAGGQDEVGVRKLDMLHRLLTSSTSNSETVSRGIVSQLFGIVNDAVRSSLTPPKSAASQTPPPPPTILRASCFVLAHMLLSPAATDTCHAVFLNRLHTSLLPAASVLPRSRQSSLDQIEPPVTRSRTVLETLTTLSTLFLYSPPLPGLQTLLIGPILPALASLAMFVGFDSGDDEEDQGRKALGGKAKARVVVIECDRRFGNEVRALLETWAKSAEGATVVKRIRQLVEDVEQDKQFGQILGGGAEDEQLEWSWDEDGGVCVRRRFEKRETTDVLVDAAQIVKWLELVNRKDVSGALFVRWLDELQILRTQVGFESAKRAVIRLQLVLQMVDALGSDILTEPEQIIAFVAHALEADRDIADEVVQSETVDSTPASDPTFGLGSLKIVDDEHESRNEASNDDEDAVIPGLGADEIVTTALTLLLAVLEGNEHLDMGSTPMLATIFDKLDSFSSSESELVPPLAREAKLVLSSRRASRLATQSSETSNDTVRDDTFAQSRSTYQQALKLLQDPLLPVRAQGLALLKSLVSSKEAFLSTDQALLPAVLDIFVQALQDDDSFLYLNAIQGLSGMADVFGEQVVKRLVEIYVGGSNDSTRTSVGTGDKGRRELDKRLRMGEALVQVVRRAGQALAVIVYDVVPQLLFVMRTSTLPTPLRSSALTILATTIETAPVALMPFAETLAESCLTLLSVESRPLVAKLAQAHQDQDVVATEQNQVDDDEVDDEFKTDVSNLFAQAQVSSPTGSTSSTGPQSKKRTKVEETPDAVSSFDAKSHPSLRRASILFLGLLFRTVDEQIQDLRNSTEPLIAEIKLPGRRTRQNLSSSSSTSRVTFETIARARVVLRYVHETDRDELVRYQAGQVLQELDE
ncbi:hypothetical protein ACM66B_002284 [Microbotryomycetes sp. NB124-2]